MSAADALYFVRCGGLADHTSELYTRLQPRSNGNARGQTIHPHLTYAGSALPGELIGTGSSIIFVNEETLDRVVQKALRRWWDDPTLSENATPMDDETELGHFPVGADPGQRPLTCSHQSQLIFVFRSSSNEVMT